MKRRKKFTISPPIVTDRPYGGYLSLWHERQTSSGRDTVDLRDDHQIHLDEARYLLERDLDGRYLRGAEIARPYRGISHNGGAGFGL